MKVYVSKDGKEDGPFTVEQLQEDVFQGNFTAEDLACHDGQNWVKIAQVPGFAEATQPAVTSFPETPRQDQVVQEKAVEQQPPPADASSLPSKKKKIILWTGIGGVATLLVASLLLWILGEAIDLDDKETLDKIIAEAIDWDKLQKRGKGGEEVRYAPNEQTPYTGWVKGMYKNGQIKGLTQFKDGKADGLWTMWYENGQEKWESNYKGGKNHGLVTGWYSNGQKMQEGNWKAGKPDGLMAGWYETGQKRREFNYKDGNLVTAIVWKPNGEKCPDTNLKKGDGTLCRYHENGQKEWERTYKDGEQVKD